MAHCFILNGLDIRHVRQTDTAANQLRAAESDRVFPYLFQEFRGVARGSKCRIARFLTGQDLEALREGVPQRLNVGQTLFTGCSGIANTEMPRQAAEIEQQVADGGADVKTDGTEVAELCVDGLQTAVCHENRATVNIAMQQGFSV